MTYGLKKKKERKESSVSHRECRPFYSNFSEHVCLLMLHNSKKEPQCGSVGQQVNVVSTTCSPGQSVSSRPQEAERVAEVIGFPIIHMENLN